MSNELHNPSDSQLKHFHGYAKPLLSNQPGLYRASTWCLVTLTDLVDRSVSMSSADAQTHGPCLLKPDDNWVS